MSSSLSPPEVVFDPVGSRYHTFRIPAVTMRGDWLFAFCEGRLHSAADAGEIEVVLRRSGDGGRTWLPLRVVSAAAGKTCGNPVPIVDPASGDLVLVTVQNGADELEHLVALGTDVEDGRRVYVQRSIDDGASWSAPSEITAQVKPRDWGWYATGPCHGIALTAGPYAGRLVVPANHSFVPADVGDLDSAATARLNGGHCIFSDDGGRTWALGFVDRNDGGVVNANETAVAELGDGRLYFTARNHRGTGPARVHAYSSDGGATLESPYEGIAEITAPGIQGSVLRVGDRLLLSTPAHPEIRRELTVFVSTDSGATWRPGFVVHPGMAGYSDLVPLPDGRVGLFYEAGETSSFATLRFVTFDPREIL
ncbi:sialidase-1 [Kribbella voronezhensis]|uniref:exo-alpha-sialidase n=1 Tax=Kribbella voronezhensis TaxID=2512212 RepID=A0A4R7TFV4_9ACTN|nr:sialidase family protein [Kribbella voronezhensis]TDU91074.1 sialidase-1 [Kribbella voronezhensis]